MIPPSASVTTYAAYSAAILSALKERFGTDFRYGQYELEDELSGEPDSIIETPALLLEVDAWDEDPDEIADPLGRRRRRFSVQIHCLLGILTPSLQVALRELSLEVDGLLSPANPVGTRRPGAQWGLGAAVDPPESIGARPGEFRPGLHGVDSWIVSFEQVVYLA